MNIYQIPINDANAVPKLVATTIDKFLGMLNDELIDVENYYFTTSYETTVLSSGFLHHTKT